MPDIGNGRQDAWRANASAWRWAIDRTLASRPVSDSPNLLTQFPSAADLLEAVDNATEALPARHPLRMARERIVEYLRSHSDMSAFRDFLGVDDAWMDDFFEDAMDLEQ